MDLSSDRALKWYITMDAVLSAACYLLSCVMFSSSKCMEFVFYKIFVFF